MFNVNDTFNVTALDGALGMIDAVATVIAVPTADVVCGADESILRVRFTRADGTWWIKLVNATALRNSIK